jgi:adenosylcobyric acid synthase
MTGLTGAVVNGYEIHMGQTRTDSPWLEILERGGEPCRVADGAASPTGRVWGCYLHGLFANDTFRRAWLASLRPDFRAAPASAAAGVQAGLDRLADAVAEAVPVARLEQILREGVPA